MTKKKIIAASALAFLLSAGAAFAQTTTAYPTTNGTTGASGTVNRTASTSRVGVPNTGAGGNAAENIALLGISSIVAVGAGFALLRRGFA